MSEKEEKDFDALNIETYLVMTARYIYCLDVDNLEWLFDPIPIENIATMQLSTNNQQVAVLKRRYAPKTSRACPFIIVENSRMEEMIRFVKRTYSGAISNEYKDTFNFKNDQGEERAFNMVTMSVFKPTDMDLRFADATMHGFLEKMTIGWRSFFSSSPKITWVK